VAVLLLLATLIAVRTVDFRERIPLARPLGQVPMTIGEWSGVRSAMEQRFLDDLKLSDYLLADYRNPQGKTVNAYVAYNESQRKGSRATPRTRACRAAGGSSRIPGRSPCRCGTLKGTRR